MKERRESNCRDPILFSWKWKMNRKLDFIEIDQIIVFVWQADRHSKWSVLCQVRCVAHLY